MGVQYILNLLYIFDEGMDNVRIKLLSTERHHLQFEEANDIPNEDTENILTDVSRRGEKRGKDQPGSPPSVKVAKKKRI